MHSTSPQKNTKKLDPSSLNHNNIAHKYAGKKPLQRSVPKRIQVQEIPMRPFPGEIREIKRGVIGAVYAEDLEKEETLMKQSLDMTEEISKEDLMREQDFLKLDQSKLPLEMFDNLEYEAQDKSPSEWLTITRRGFTPFYEVGEWTWSPVIIHGYNDETKEFMIQFYPDGIRKNVMRLNVRFDQESESAFNARREFAIIAREEAKKILRLDHYINQQPKEVIRAIRQTSLRKIHEKVIEGLSVSVPFPEEGTNLGFLLSNLTKELIRWYSRTMKKTVLFAQVSNIPRFRVAATVQKYKQLELPTISPKPKAPYSGKVACAEYPYLERRARVASAHYSSSKEVLSVYKWLLEKWNKKYQYYSFVDVKLAGLALPCTLDAFKRAQNEKSDLTAKQLKIEVRTAFLDQFLDSVQDVFDFFQSNLAAYKSSALFRLNRVLDLMLSNFLRQVLLESLASWERLVNLNAQVTLDNSDAIPNEVSFLRDSERTFSLASRLPLFQVELRVINGRVVLEPSVDDIQGAFMQAIDKMISTVRSVTSVDKDTMSLLTLEPRVLLNIGVGDPLFSDLDAMIKMAKTHISSNIAAAMKRPLALAKLYEEYVWLMEYDEYTETFASQDPPPTQEDFKRELYKLDGAAKTIEKISFQYEDFDMVRVDARNAKEMLCRHALEMRDGLLAMVASGAKDENLEIVHQYNAMLDRIAEKPTNEEQLAALRDYIITSKQTVLELQARVAETRQNLAILDVFSVPLHEDDMVLSWEILKYPARIEASGREVELTLESDKDRMVVKLTFEKEQFSRLLDKIGADVQAAKLLSDYNDKEKIVEKFNALSDTIQDAKTKGENFNMRERVFGFVTADYGVLDHYTEELSMFNRLWTDVSDFHNSKNDWLNGDFRDLDGKAIEEKMTEWWRSSLKLAKGLEEDYEEVAACAMLLREETSEFKKHLPVIQSLASRALKPRHWEKISELLGKMIDPDDDLHLQDLLDLDAAAFIEQIQEVTVAAEKEYNLERQLKGMQRDWESVEFEVKAYKETGTFVVGGIDDIMTLLDDHIVKTQTMRGNPFIKPIEVECKDWEVKLKYAQGLLDAWTKCQRTWMYLEPIFGSEDIMRQLPTESKRFGGVDSLWRKTLQDTSIDANFMRNAEPEKRLEEKFKKANEKLDEIQKGLNDYLEMKRLYFPRFFFLSDDELLEILSQTKEPRAVQPHLGKCFEGVNKVKFEADLKISQMISAEGEVVVMDRVIDPETQANKGNVEKWLLELESIQWDSMRSLTVASIEQYKSIPRRDWILNWPAQVILGVSSVYWTIEVTEALRASGGQALQACFDQLNHQLRDIVNLVRGKLDKMQRQTLGALTTIDVHNRDVVGKMVELGTSEVTDFQWVSQLRYYWEDSWKDGQGVKKNQKTVVARIVNAKCLYGYEYLGNSSRLVMTALTDRCYRTMIGAVDLLYGGAPEGPAGTGKTETVKDLSKAVAIHCVVFNCSDGLDYLAMAKFFKGLAGCGSWCCFDEFNRINIEVLSVIAQQILVINQGKRENRDMFYFEGTHMKLNSNCNVFITMNPGYAGRAELPDNLKALFRPCAMMVPDYAMIGEIRLYSFGFESARENAQKIVRVLQLSSEQLSSQKHYDYGMRAVNSILVAAGNLRQLLGDDPQWDEAKIVLRSINDVNLAKFLVEDLPLFKGITSDLFPGVVLPSADYETLTACINYTCDAGIEIAPGNVVRLENKPEYVAKAIQLYEMVLVRHGVMVVGQTCSGKTSTIHNLAKAMTKANNDGSDLFAKVQIYTINPKSVTSGQLYGMFDENTREFVDGILAVTFRRCARDSSPDRKWMMFDGPVDAVWIENMNTVLDDNKKLCLNSGEIIKMSDTMTMFFEAEDLEQASPATVSRVGMIFCETRNIGWEAVRNIWLESLSDINRPHELFLAGLFDWLFPMMSYFVSKFCFQPMQIAPQELVFMQIKLLRSLLDYDEGVATDVLKAIEGCFYFSLIWSMGAVLDGDGRKNFDRLLRLALTGEVYTTPEFEDFRAKNPDYVIDVRKASQHIPESNPVYDYFFDAKSGKWVHWLENQPIYRINREAKFNAIVVPTIDSVRNEWLIEKLLRKGYHVMCTGDTGTGKSVTVKNKLLSGMPSKFNSIFLNFSAQTSANQTQDLIDSKLDKRRLGVLGPPLGNVCVVFVDDLNMPAKEVFGAQPPIEILRQWMDHQGWYDRKENTFRRLVDIQFCAAMGPPGGGRTRITQRYVRHFNLINFVNFSNDSLAKVFSTILDWRMSQGFAPAVKQLSQAAVQATIGVFNSITSNLLPTPAKSHYTFNLRDLSKVFQGVLMGDPDNFAVKEDFIRLWSHECMRVFHDRLVDDADRKWFNELVAKTVKEQFNIDYAKIKGEHLNVLFANFANKKRNYCELGDRAELQKTMLTFLDDYNQNTNKPMSLVLFSAAIEHVARISRIINQPYGNALLVGVGGSGRKSLTTLAVSIADFKLFTIEITKSYGMADWREDIKKMMNDAGVLNKPTVFMMDDTQIVKEAFLEDINGILNTGEVANLFNSEEMGVLMEALAKPCQEAGVNPGSPGEVYNFFVGRVRTNLHLVLCLSPIGEAFRTRLRMFPSLVNCCTIDWFTEWPEEALRSVADFFLATVELDDKVKAGVVDVCVDMQVTAVTLSKRFLAEMSRHYYVTPTSYLELINTFKSLLNFQRAEVYDAKARYDNGLSKLQKTSEQVNSMQVELELLQPELQQATVETDALLVKATADKAIANEQSLLVEAEAEKCNVQASEAKALKDSCEADLAAALPALEAAENALNNLDKSDITEMKAMKKPSPAIKMTMAAISILFNVKPDKKVKDGDQRIDPYWGPATKELLSDPKLIDRLKNFDRDNMEPAVVAKVKTFTDDEEFEPERVAKKGSVAAAGLAKWVHAMVLYDGVARQVAPKRASLKEAEQTLRAAQEDLAVKEAALKEVLDKVAELEAQLKEASDKKERLNTQVLDCEAKLRRADALIKGLGGEKSRWTEMSRRLAQTYENVTGDILLSAGVIAYLGAFVASYREHAIVQWSALLRKKQITCAEAFSLRETLGNPVQIRSWTINKLPNDSFSVENGIMLFRSNRWPLMIDPQGQANKWVKKMEEHNGLKIVKQNQGNFIRILENAIQFGSPVLLENVPENLDPILESVLLKQVVVSGGIATIRLGDSTIDYDKNFRLYITTKLSNPHYPPELCVKVNLLNFMATQDGLQDQMLGKVVALEHEELEKRRAQLVLEDAENQRQLKEIEEEILRLLKNAQGNILDDEVLINTLADSKKTSNIIQEKVKVAEHTQQSIAKVRQGYIPVAFQAARLFFCIADLAQVDPMYQYSLDWYISLFEMSIKQATKSKNLEERLTHLNDCFTYLLYANVCRSLFEKDKLLFSFLLTTKILLGRKTLHEAELRLFLQGSTSMESSEPNPFPQWLTDRAWNDILSLCEIPAFHDLKANIKSNHLLWREVIDASAPSSIIDTILGDSMDSFKKLCVLRCFRADMVVPGVQEFIRSQMGVRFIEPPQFDMQACFSDSQCTTPLIFVLTPGAAPMTELTKLAEERGFAKKLQAISLGQGQGPIAEKAVQDASDKGLWVCLQNCHLCTSWMPTLEKICEEFSAENLHPDFRLWLTSEPSPSFPPFVLQNGIKMTNEPPKGMRANLLGSLSQIKEESFETSLRKEEFKKMLFGLCFFHAGVRERRKFGPLGWNIQYVFSPPDLQISMDQLRMFLDDLKPSDSIPFAALAYLVGECNYGGRVTDDKDRRCIMNILDDFYTPDILTQDYKFSPSPVYYSPAPGSLDDYKEYVRGLPFYEGPEIFGLHENANISCALSETNALLDTALSLQPRSSGGEGKSWGETLDELAKDILARIPEPFDIERALILFPVRYDESMNTVLTQELMRFNRLIVEIKTSLVDVQKALKGLVLLSSELESMGNAMVIGKVPAKWAAVAYPSLKPLGSWVTDLLERIHFLKEWMENGSPNVYWISGFFFTQAFITGTLQNFARKYTIPIDQAEFDFKVLNPTEMAVAPSMRPEDGAYLRGLFLEGARWDKDAHVLAESHPRELFVQMPFIHLVPKLKDHIPTVEGVPEQYTGSRTGTAHVYMCPIYKTSFRQGVLSTTGHSTNFVMFVRIPMWKGHEQKHWIKRGVALLTQLDS